MPNKHPDKQPQCHLRAPTEAQIQGRKDRHRSSAIKEQETLTRKVISHPALPEKQPWWEFDPFQRVLNDSSPSPRVISGRPALHFGEEGHLPQREARRGIRATHCTKVGWRCADQNHRRLIARHPLFHSLYCLCQSMGNIFRNSKGMTLRLLLCNEKCHRLLRLPKSNYTYLRSIHGTVLTGLLKQCDPLLSFC